MNIHIAYTIYNNNLQTMNPALTEAISLILDDKDKQLEKLDQVELAEVKARIEIEAIDAYYNALLKKRVLQVEEQEKEIERLGKFIETLQIVHFKEYQGEKAENKRLREALEFYADETKYERVTLTCGDKEIFIERDCGKTARKALAGESK